MANSAGNNGDDKNLQSDEVREDFDKRLSDLNKKISAAKGEEVKEGEDEPSSTSRAYSYAFRIATELVTAPIVGAFLGWWIDSRMGTKPLFLLILLVLGLAAGIRSVMRTALEMQAMQDDSRDKET